MEHIKEIGFVIQIGTAVFLLGGAWAVWKYQVKGLVEKVGIHEKRLDKKHDQITALENTAKNVCRKVDVLNDRLTKDEEKYLTYDKHEDICGLRQAELRKHITEESANLSKEFTAQLRHVYQSMEAMRLELKNSNGRSNIG